jgi:hypothetical protein
MVTNTQYALLVGVPTGAIILAAVVMSFALRRFLRIMHSNFDRIDRTMNAWEQKDAEALRNTK